MDFCHSQSEAMEDVKRLQASIRGLHFHDSYQAVSTGSLTPGCEICTHMAHMSFQLGFRCNAKCPFCFLHTYSADKPDETERHNRLALLREFHQRKNQLEGVALSGGEPLLYLPELEACVSEMREARPELHFWVYTNGILADDKHLDIVHESGIKEIRFNLAATNYDDRILDNLERARRIFEHVAVEVPSYPKQRDRLMGCLGELDGIGIDQLNLQELLVTDANADSLDGEGYQVGMMFVKRFFLYGSRKMTYEVMRHCIDKKYSFTVNDCTASQFGKR